MTLWIAYTRLLRRTTRQFLSRFFSDFNELAIFMTTIPRATAREAGTIGRWVVSVNGGAAGSPRRLVGEGVQAIDAERAALQRGDPQRPQLGLVDDDVQMAARHGLEVDLLDQPRPAGDDHHAVIQRDILHDPNIEAEAGQAIIVLLDRPQHGREGFARHPGGQLGALAQGGIDGELVEEKLPARLQALEDDAQHALLLHDAVGRAAAENAVEAIRPQFDRFRVELGDRRP